MPILFSDDFSIPGAVAGRPPAVGWNTQWGAETWSSAASLPVISAGFLTTPDAVNNVIYEYSGPPVPASSSDVTLTAVVRTPLSVAPVGQNYQAALSVRVFFGTVDPVEGIPVETYSAEFAFYFSGGLPLRAMLIEETNSGFDYAQASTSLLGDTEYTVELAISGGARTLKIDGVTVASFTADRSVGMSEGTKGIDVGLWKAGSGLGSISLADNSGATPPVVVVPGVANSTLTGPSPTLLSAGRSSVGDNDFTYTAPKPSLSTFGGANSRLRAPGPALSVTATFTNWGQSDISAPSAALSASGTVSGVGQAALTFSDPYKLIGFSGAVASITLTGKYTVQVQSTAGSIGGAAITCPLFELSASGTAQNYGSASLLAPAARLGAQAQAWLMAPRATLTAIGSATITATYEAYAVNLLHPPAARGQAAPVDQTTRYTNFPFTHVVRYRNSYYGANATGLYLLEGTTDDGVDIPYTLRTAISDFKSPFRKTVASAYFGGRLGPDATMTLYAGEGAQTQAYNYTTPRGALAQNYRQAFGKGIRQHRYYAVGISGSDAMALDSLELDTHNSTRRI